MKLVPVKEAGPDDAPGTAATAKKATAEKPPVDSVETIEAVLTDKDGTFRFAKVPLVRNWLPASRIYDNGRLTKVTMRNGMYSRLGHIG